LKVFEIILETQLQILGQHDIVQISVFVFFSDFKALSKSEKYALQ